jgi:hypothetical protein
MVFAFDEAAGEAGAGPDERTGAEGDDGTALFASAADADADAADGDGDGGLIAAAMAAASIAVG